MAFKSLKKHIGNLATPFLTNIASSLVNSGSQKDAGKVAAQLLKKGPFDIPNNPIDASEYSLYLTVQKPIILSPLYKQ